ncbi:MAG: Oxidoreductase [Novosphingobium sp.]|nr:Oxidoreductase [Novosphingobium sp.]
MRPSILITGGARRIGAEIARAFGTAGWHVVIHHSHSHDEAEALAASLPSAEALQADFSDPAAGPALIEELAGRLEDWRMLVNSASIFKFDDGAELDHDIFAEAMQVNAGAPAHLAQGFLKHARAAGGRRVVQVTDQKLANPNPDFFSYTMSKHAHAATIPMLAMTQADPRDRIYGLAPGAILASHDQSEEETDVSHRMNLLHRKTGADEIAAACLFLSEGWLASGETLFIDSGQHLMSQQRDVLYLARQ